MQVRIFKREWIFCGQPVFKSFQSVLSYVILEGPKSMCSSLLLTDDPASSLTALFVDAKWFRDKAHR